MKHKHKNKEILFLILPVVLFLVLASYKLGTTSLWLDEILSLDISDGSLSELREGIRQETHAPFSYLVLYVFLKLFGVSEFVGRLPGVLSAVGGIIALYFFARQLTDSKTALMSCIILATSPFYIEFAREIRRYALSAPLAVLVWIYFLRIIRRGEKRDACIYAGVAALLLLTFYWGIAILLFQFIFTWFLRISPRKKKILLLSWITAGGVFLPWLPTFIYQYKQNKVGIIERYFPAGITINDVLVRIEDMLLGTSVYDILGLTGILLTGVIIILCLIQYVRIFRRGSHSPLVRTKSRLILLIPWTLWGPFLVFVGLCLIRPIFLSRYLMMLAPFVALFLGTAISYTKRKKTYLFLSALVLVSLFSYHAYLKRMPRQDWRGPAYYLVAHIQPKDVIVTANINDTSCLIYYFKMLGRAELNHNTFPFKLFYRLTRGRYLYPTRTLWFLWTNPQRQKEQLSILQNKNTQIGRIMFLKGVALYKFTGKSSTEISK
ncbi:glycosyltransferase family 39 protein [Candidatus Sumerlaeota bacterium]|nr:glycosyltransferase family 39 protein [Candidatus Sumerlaeota bacterium]